MQGEPAGFPRLSPLATSVMQTTPRLLLAVGLGAMLLLMTWALVQEEPEAEPLGSLATATRSSDPSAIALPLIPSAASETRGHASAASEATTPAQDPDSASVEFRLVAASGAPARGAEAWFSYSWEQDPSDAFPFPIGASSESAAESMQHAGSRVPSRDDGLVRLTGIRAGRDVVVHARGPQWSASPQRIAPLSRGEVRQLGTISVFHASRLHGRMLDLEDRPVAHAIVELRVRDGRLETSDASKEGLRTVSGDEGEFEFPGVLPGVYSLRGNAQDSGLAVIDPLLIPEGGGDVSVELRLLPGTPLQGRILDEHLHPLTTARIQLTDGNARVADILRDGTAVDDEGRFQVVVPAEIGLDRLVAAAPGYAASSTDSLRSGRPIELVLSPVATVTGRIVDASRAPVAGALIRLHSSSSEARLVSSAVDGSFECADVAPGSYRIEASAACGSAAIPSLLVHPGLDPIELGLLGESGVLVTVLGPDSEPLHGATVEIFPEQVWEQEVRRAEEAAFAFAPVPVAETEQAPASEELARVALDAPAMDETATLTSAPGAPTLVALPRRGLTDENGRVWLLGIPSGTWEIQASSEGFLDGTLYFERSAEAIDELSLRLQPASSLRVQVVGPAGEAVPHTDMALTRVARSANDEEAGVLLGARTDANGLAVWRNPPPGDYTLQVRVARSSSRAEHSAESLDSSETLRVQLEAGATVEERFELRSLCLPSVRVTRRGIPVPGALVEIQPGRLRIEEVQRSSLEPLRRSAIAADASGKVELPACSPGVHRLAASSPAGAPTTSIEIDLTRGPQQIELALAEGRIAGRVEGPGGSIAGAEIHLLPAFEPTPMNGADSDGGQVPAETSATLSEGGSACTTVSDRAGAFLIDDVPAGRYRLHVRAPQFASWLSESFEHDGRRCVELGRIALIGAATHGVPPSAPAAFQSTR